MCYMIQTPEVLTPRIVQIPVAESLLAIILYHKKIRFFRFL